MMKSALPVVVLTITLLGACVQLPAPVIQNHSGHHNNPNYSGLTHSSEPTSSNKFKLASTHWSDVAAIREEARRLNQQVGSGSITKVQAAQYLNRFRLKLVGKNSVDDSVYDMYLRSVVDSQRGEIDSAKSKANVENALKGWQQRWQYMDNRPNNPAFTNFLLELMRMEPLK